LINMKSSDTSTFDFRLDPAFDNYAVMGNPVAHSKSPLIHQEFARQTNQPIRYQALFVPIGRFEDAIQEFRRKGGKGLNVTVPFKEDAWQAVSVRTCRAETAGAVNTISFLAGGESAGDNTDGVGLLRDLGRNGIAVKDKRLLILGAGGAVRGVLGPLLEAKPAELVIGNRTVSKARQLIASRPYEAQLKACSLDELSNAGSFDLIINAISAGLQGELPPLAPELIGAHTCCYDMVYGDTEPVFVRWARQRGARLARDGLGMLVEQAAEAFFIWRGVRPETGPVIEMLRKKLRSEG
jgi:shikimate dehydrogenase